MLSGAEEVFRVKNSGAWRLPNSNYLLDICLTNSGRCSPSNSRPHLVEYVFAQALRYIVLVKVVFRSFLLVQCSTAKEVRANFKLENESQSSISILVTDINIQGY